MLLIIAKFISLFIGILFSVIVVIKSRYGQSVPALYTIIQSFFTALFITLQWLI